ncbi:MAG: hypothetical protein NVSMB51_21430 [Solirubrobacteraceae bacterium]
MIACRVCAHASELVGPVAGSYSGRSFQLRRCEACGLAFIADPWLDFAAIYDERYYAGEGADPMVDYAFELAHPDAALRQYEWRGITRMVERLLGRLEGVNWLDYGCGNGGLVRAARQHGAEAIGFEEGAMAAELPRHGIPSLTRAELARCAGHFDVVTAIEVFEHTLDPVAEMRSMRALLRPGGLLFLTTGNAAPFRDRLQRWSYVIPEIHISFFEPRTLANAMLQSGLQPEFLPRSGEWDEILKFKVLKNLRLRRRSRLTDLIPASLLGAAGDRYTRLSRHPIGWSMEDPRAEQEEVGERPEHGHGQVDR